MVWLRLFQNDQLIQTVRCTRFHVSLAPILLDFIPVYNSCEGDPIRTVQILPNASIKWNIWYPSIHHWLQYQPYYPAYLASFCAFAIAVICYLIDPTSSSKSSRRYLCNYTGETCKRAKIRKECWNRKCWAKVILICNHNMHLRPVGHANSVFCSLPSSWSQRHGNTEGPAHRFKESFLLWNVAKPLFYPEVAGRNHLRTSRRTPKQ